MGYRNSLIERYLRWATWPSDDRAFPTWLKQHTLIWGPLAAIVAVLGWLIWG